jgi:hypothetical protein
MSKEKKNLIQDAQGRWFLETPRTDGYSDYVPVQDPTEYQRQVDEQSHMPFYETIRDQRQRVKRQDVLTRQLEQASQLVDPPVRSGVRTIKDEEFFELTAMYERAVKEGTHRECEFQPLATYAHKIERARPIFKGEVGTNGWEILVLENGYGVGSFSAVPFKLGD